MPILAYAFALILTALLAAPAGAVEQATRFEVTDGDSIRVGSERIRLHGIDAPELAQDCLDARGRAWACGQWARTQLREITRGKRLNCTRLDTDRFGRTIATCFAGGQDIAQAMVERGAAVAFRRYGLDYVAAEEAARVARRGIWAGRFQHPDDWRAATRQSEVMPVAGRGGCEIKGNISRSGERIYHIPGQRDYAKTMINERDGERWFCSEEEARAAGWRRAKR